jgi:hypothetical protein
VTASSDAAVVTRGGLDLSSLNVHKRASSESYACRLAFLFGVVGRWWKPRHDRRKRVQSREVGIEGGSERERGGSILDSKPDEWMSGGADKREEDG